MINILKLRKLEKEKNTDKQASADEIEVKGKDEGEVNNNKPVEHEISIQEPIATAVITETEPDESEQKAQKKTRRKANNETNKKNSTRKKRAEEPDGMSVSETIPDNDKEVNQLLGEINEIEKELIELQEKTYKEEKDVETAIDPAEIFRANLLKELLEEENNSMTGMKEEVKTEEIIIPVELEKAFEAAFEAENVFEAEKPIEAVKPVEIKKQVIESNEPVKAVEIEKPAAQNVSLQYEEKPIEQISNIISSIQKEESLVKGDIKKKNNESIVQLVGFMLSNEYYGVDIMKIREIIRMVDITRVPRAPHFIEGVINLRGTVIPVINLRTKVRMPRLEYDKNTRIVIVEIGGTIIGFIVDAVREVLRIQENCLEAPPAITIEKADYITSVAKLDDQLVILMDTEKVLSNEEGKLLGDMAKNK